MYKNQSGIYIITNLENGKVYIGSTIDFDRRWKAHRSELRRSSHGNSYLQRSWDKYGEEVFEFGILEYLDNPEELVKAEQFWMDIYREEGKELYNTALVASAPMLGCKHTKEAKQKISESKMGKTREPFSEECRYNMSESAKNRPPVSEEVRRKSSEVHMGHPVSKETRRKVSKGVKAAWADGKYNSKETKQKMSESRMGEHNPMYGKHHSEETKQKIRGANLGKKHSEETKCKMSESHKGNTNTLGHRLSEEHKRKIGESVKASWTKRRYK